MNVGMMAQIVLTCIFYAWLFLVLALLWRHALGGGAHIHRLHLLLNETTHKSVETANKAAEAAQLAAEAAQKLAALLATERARDV